MFELTFKELELTKKLNNEDELMDFFKMDFRDLEGYEGHYATNVHCDIWSYKSQKFRKPRLEKDSRTGEPAYWKIDLCKDNVKKTVRLHRLLGLAYIPNDDPNGKTLIGHNDDNKQNLDLSNLYWTDAKENNTHNDIHKRKKKCKNLTK